MTKQIHQARNVVQQTVTVRARRTGSAEPIDIAPLIDPGAPSTRSLDLFGAHYGKHGKYHGASNVSQAPGAQLTPEGRHNLFVLSGDIRASIESVARKVMSQKRKIVPRSFVDMDNKEMVEEARRQAERVDRKLRMPNENELEPQFWFRVVVELLKQESAVVEPVKRTVTTTLRNGQQVSRETTDFVPIYSGNIEPVVDEDGRLTGYVQKGATSNQDKKIAPEEIYRMMLNPVIYGPWGLPIMDTLVRQIVLIVRGEERAITEFSESEIGAGFLMLTGTSPKQVDLVKRSVRNQRGRDDKLRVLHTPGATAPAQWLELKRSFKEIEFQPITEQQRRLIWRMFGVSPVSQGETSNANRSDADALLEVDESGIFGAVLQMLQGFVNQHMIPAILEGEEGILVEMEWERGRKLTPEQLKDQAEEEDIRLANGTLTINEARQSRGLDPIDGGNIARINGVPVNPDDDGPDDDSDPEAAERHVHGPACADGECRPFAERRRNRDELPSDWQSPGAFDGVRTVDLRALWDEVVRYRRGVEPIWRRLREDLTQATERADRRGGRGDFRHIDDIEAAIERTRGLWATETLRRYTNVAQIGADSAARYAMGIDFDVDAFAEQYHRDAMTFLEQLLSDVQTRVTANVLAARTKTTAESNISPESDIEELLDAVELSVDANEHRIDNWSGRLVEVAAIAFATSMLSATEEVEPGEDVEPATQWFYYWEAVLDDGTCVDCEREGSAGIRPLSTITVYPGGDTQCGPRCRCVLVVWTAEEVASGVARKIL